MATANNCGATRAKADLRTFLNERWKGMSPVAWGDTLRESDFSRWLYGGVCGIASTSEK
jgi:glycerol-3-phosphate dehydrogenase